MKTKTLIIGIDPGQTGAITFYNPKKKKIIGVHDLPIRAKTFGRENGKMIDSNALANLINWYQKNFIIKEAYIEHVSAMPKQGVVAVFSFGMTFGTLLTVLLLSNIDIRLVAARTWKNEAGLTGKPKKAATKLAKKLFPEVDFRLTKEATDRADSILIVHYGLKVPKEKIKDLQFTR